jgi:hypothetical protein
MPGFLAHLGAQVLCSHGGQAQPTAPNPRVMVSGQPTVLVPAPYVIAGCALPPPTAGNGPCVTAIFTSGTTRVLSNGLPLMCQSSQAVCVPSGTPAFVVFTQTRVTAL